MTTPTNMNPIILNAPDPVAPEAGGPLNGETIASVYLHNSGLVPEGSGAVKFFSENVVSVECTTAEQLAAFQARLQKATDGFLYDANNNAYDRDKMVIVTQAQIDKAVAVATTMILETGGVSRAEVFKKAGIVANAGEFESIFRRRGFELNALAKGGLEDLLETNRAKAAEVFANNLRAAFTDNKNAKSVKFWDKDGNLTTRNDLYWVDPDIFNAALAAIAENLKTLLPPPPVGEGEGEGGSAADAGPVDAADAATVVDDSTFPAPSLLRRGDSSLPSSPVPVPSVVEGGEGAKDDGGIDLGFWGWSGVVAWGIASLALFVRSSRQRILHAITAPMPPERPHDRRVIPNAIGGSSSPHLRERLAASFADSWSYIDGMSSDVLQKNARMQEILYNLVQCTSDDQAVDYLWREAAFAQKMSPGELLARLEKANGGNQLFLAEQAVYFLHLIAEPDMRVETAARYKGAEFVRMAGELKAPPSPQPSPIEGEGVTRVPSPLVGEGQGEGGREARLDAIGEDWFLDEDGRKGATADGPPPLPEAEVAEPVKPAVEVAPVRKGAPRKRRHHVGEHPAVGAGAAAAADAGGTPSPRPSPIKGEGKRASAPAAQQSPMPRTYEELLKDLNLDALAGNLDAAKFSETIALGVSGMATADPRYEGLEMQVWVLKEWMAEAGVADSATTMREFLQGYYKSHGSLDAKGFVEQTQVRAEKERERKMEIRSRFAEVERKAREHVESERARRKAGK